MLHLLPLLATLSGPAFAQDDEPLYMEDMGITAELPDGWTVPKWGSWYLDALDSRQTTQIHVGYTLFQVTPTPDAARAWAEMAVEQLSEKHSDVQVVSATAADGVASIEITYKFEGKRAAIYIERAWPISGKVVHLSATGLARNEGKVRAGLETWQDALKIEKPAQDLAGTAGRVESESGFAATLPDGWRQPLASELSEARKLAAKAGQGKLDKELCWVGVKPHPEGDTALAMACQAGKYLGILDEHSFEGEEAAFRADFFAGAPVEITPAVSYPTADRLSMLYDMPEGGEVAVRMAVTPYEKGLVLTYTMGRHEETADLDATIRSVLDTTEFTGEGGGQPPQGLWAWIQYAKNYRPELLAAGLAPFILFFGFIIYKARTTKPSWEDVD